jgi:phosphatidylserine decarboxylase
MSVLASIRSQLAPVHREGLSFIGAFAVGSLLLFWVWPPLGWLGVLATLWCTYFFRDPARERPLPRVSIFMSVFDCHVNRSPLAGKIERIIYHAGAFVSADLDKASESNERNSLLITSDGRRVGVVQIAGLVARRIVCFVREGSTVAAGERIGMIRFGSRVDIYLPAGARPLVAEGQTAIAGETVIADLAAGAAQRSFRVD